MTNGRRVGFVTNREEDHTDKWSYDYPVGTILKVISQSGTGLGYLSEESTEERIHLKPSVICYPDFDIFGNDIPKYRLEDKLPTVIERIGPITYIPLLKEDLDKLLSYAKHENKNPDKKVPAFYSGRIIKSKTRTVRPWNPPELPLEK